MAPYGKSPQVHGTTVLCVRKDNKVVLAADGQVTLGETVIKHSARKTRRLFNDKILAGFAGSTADALSLFPALKISCRNITGTWPGAPWNWRKSGAPTDRFATSTRF